MKRLNPVIQSQWKKDREKVVVYSQRAEEIQLLKRQLPNMNDAEQAKWVAELTRMLEKETSPELRREAILALAKVANRSDAAQTIQVYTKDKNDKVRLATIQPLRDNPTPESTAALLALATSDNNNHVRLTAIESLGKHKNDQVRQFLISKLEDRSPASQYEASLALKEFTGKDYGGDIEAWKRYLAGEDVPEPKPSLAQSLQSMWPLKR